MNQDQFLLDTSFFGWLYKLLTPIEWLMTQVMNIFHTLFTTIGMPAVGMSWILSIIFLVVVVHACIFPLFYRQMLSMRKMQALQPKMQHIQNKYKGKNDQASKEALQREMMKLYQDNGANPMGSCLPALIQGPVFMCMFYVLSAIPFIARGKRSALGAFNTERAQEFSQTKVFGVSVTDTFVTANTHGKIIIAVFVMLMCAAMWYMQYNNMQRNMPESQKEGTAYKTQQMMTWIFPIMYIFSGISMPFAVLVYWLTNNIINLLRSIWQIRNFPTPGSQADEVKKKRDYEHENARRKKAGQLSIEEEALEKAKLEAERREKEGFQRYQPSRKKNKKRK